MSYMINRYLFVVFFVSALMDAAGQPVKPELFAPGIISGAVHDAAPAFSPDGKTVYFHRSGPALSAVILVSRLRNGVWSAPDIASFSGSWQDIEPAMAPDGSYLIFSSNRPVVPGGKRLDGVWNGKVWPTGGGNLWRVDRKGEGWGEPYRLPDMINRDASVFSPAITGDGTLYFMRPVGDSGKFHLYRSAYRDGSYEQPVAAPFSSADTVGDVDPAVAPDESFLVFSSRRPPATQNELFIVFRNGAVWGVPRSLGVEVNRSVGNIEARLSPDHRRLYFSSTWVPKTDDPGEAGSKRRAMACSEWETGMLNIWWVPLDKWLEEREKG
ncbi:PD40 domain-containing protein [Puia dinghuensis]|uniref:WD40-like Beta Propeller Repeat n=1 Tax=Puia dinghuensis TaxID=1792502 RepID=A0A8J2UHC8_9BACT|nr:PD40 domain-containing protein [Puia dinghuensis]GGB18194.1 hypothetical protein GCM10011511_47520 [Puia dinghuensis]